MKPLGREHDGYLISTDPDDATFGWLRDVYVLPAHSERGLAKAVLRAVREHPTCSDTKRLLVATEDAQLYTRLDFTPLNEADNWMEDNGGNI